MSFEDSEVDAISSKEWTPNRAAAVLLRSAVFVLPLLCGLATFWLIPAGPVVSLLCALGVLIAAHRVAQQLAPLSTLYELALIFPESAPTRRAIAKRIRSSNVEQQLLAIATGDDFVPEDPQIAAERGLVLVGLLDRHDRLTAGHSVRVAGYVDQTAAEMGLPADERAKLTWAALLHDIGKLKVSSEILTGDDAPNESERVQLEEHPGHSADLMRSLFDWLGDAFGAATEHHERVDGAGYPLALVGDEISMAGRITAVADAFDVMTAAKSYRQPMSIAEARSELMACSGSQFDPSVVQAFNNLEFDKKWARPVAWLFETPGLSHNSLGLAPLAAAAVAVVVLAGVVGVGSGAETTADPGNSPQPSELAIVDAEAELTSTTSPAPSSTTSSVAPEATTSAPTSSSLPETSAPAEPATTVDPSQVRYPSASDDNYSTGPGGWIVMDVLANDDSGDFPWDANTLDFYIEPEHGDKWEALASGQLRYRPLLNYAGPDTFSYVVCNKGGHCAVGTVIVAVQEN